MLVASVSAGVAQEYPSLLNSEQYKHYVQLFEEQERAAAGRIDNGVQPTESAWSWMQREIPWFDSPDKQFEEMYYLWR